MIPVHELKSFVLKERPIIQLLEHILAAFQTPHEFAVCFDEAGKAIHSYQEATMLRSSAALSGNEYVCRGLLRVSSICCLCAMALSM